jgi:hypothetical protein
MKHLFAITALAAVVAATAAPALAAHSNQHERGSVHAASHRALHRGFAANRGFAADPSLGNRAGINYARQTGRCVADLGYGRFEYCGW